MAVTDSAKVSPQTDKVRCFGKIQACLTWTGVSYLAVVLLSTAGADLLTAGWQQQSAKFLF